MQTILTNQHIDKLYAQIQTIRPWTASVWYHRYMAFSAALGLAFPKAVPATHLKWFHRVLLNHQLMMQEEEDGRQLTTHWEGPYQELLTLLQNRSAIICTFHTGSYRLLNHTLVKKEGLPVTLLAGDDFLKGFHHDEGVDLTTISVNRSHAALQIIRSLAAGRHVLAYVDGNMGAGVPADFSKKDPRLALPFFDIPIRVRSGLATLAHKANVPLICILPRRNQANQTVFHITQLVVDPHALTTSSRHFGEQITEAMYTDLQHLLSEQPWQWDMWFHFHDFIR